MKKSRTRRRRRRGGRVPRSKPVADQQPANQPRPHSMPMLPLLYKQAKNSPKSAQSEKPSLVLEQKDGYNPAQPNPSRDNQFQSAEPSQSLIVLKVQAQSNPVSLDIIWLNQILCYKIITEEKCVQKLSQLHTNLREAIL